MDRLIKLEWIQNAWKRRFLFALVALLLALLTLFPRHYRAVVKLSPPESAAESLGAVLGGLGGSYASLLSARPAEIDTVIARSFDVNREAVTQLGLVKPSAPALDVNRAIRKFERKATVRALRGGVLEVEALDRDPAFALRIAKVYADVLTVRLSELNREQVQSKRHALELRTMEALDRVQKTQERLSLFRRGNQLPAPEEQLQQSVTTLNSLEETLRSKRAALATESNFAAPGSYNIQRLNAEISVLQQQVAEQRGRRDISSSPSAAALAETSVRYATLQRELNLAQSLYQAYQRYLEGSAVEELAAAFTIQRLESPHIEPSRELNFVPMILLMIVLAGALMFEVYFIGPPPGVRTNVD